MHQDQHTTPPSPKWENQPSKTPPSEGWHNTASTILILLLAPLLAWLMITFVFQSYEVDGLSMERNLQDNDRLIVLKTGKTWARITNNSYIPDRGEIVIFTKRGLADYGSSQDKVLIKRIVGVPGDRVVVNNGTVTVYNDEHPEGFNPDENGTYNGIVSPTNGNVNIMVNEGELFVMGDNRQNSLDSRTFGTIQSSEVIGELVFRLFPLGNAEAF